MSDVDTLHRLLNQHRWIGGRDSTDSQCTCGWVQSPVKARHAAHVAEVIADSNWLREKQSKAWLEGLEHENFCDGCDISKSNPYGVNTEDTHTQPEAETEDRLCPTCQKYRPTIDDECTECGTDT